MANSRIARFITEVAPPQYISVMRQRASKMLDTINEEERDVSPTTSLSATTRKPVPAASTGSPAANSNYFTERVQRSFSIFEN